MKGRRASRPGTADSASDLAALQLRHDALEQRIRELEGDVVAASERERTRLRQELHDGLSQQLGGVVLIAKVHFNSLTAAQRPEAEQARELMQLVSSAAAQTRALMDHLARSK